MSAVIDMKAWKASHARTQELLPSSAGERFCLCAASMVTLSVLPFFIPFGAWWRASSSKP